MEVELTKKSSKEFAEAMEGTKRVTEAMADRIAVVAPVAMTAAMGAKALSNALNMAKDFAAAEEQMVAYQKLGLSGWENDPVQSVLDTIRALSDSELMTKKFARGLKWHRIKARIKTILLFIPKVFIGLMKMIVRQFRVNSSSRPLK